MPLPCLLTGCLQREPQVQALGGNNLLVKSVSHSIVGNINKLKLNDPLPQRVYIYKSMINVCL